MTNCKNLYYLSTIACMLGNCLDENELEILSADLRTLGEMIESIAIRQKKCCICKPENKEV